MEPSISFVRKAPEGLYTIDADRLDRGQYWESLWLPLPLSVGTEWTVLLPDDTVKFKVEAQEPLPLVDHTYSDCLRLSYTRRGGSVTGTDWYARGVGRVKSIHHSAQGVTMEAVLRKRE